MRRSVQFALLALLALVLVCCSLSVEGSSDRRAPSHSGPSAAASVSTSTWPFSAIGSNPRPQSRHRRAAPFPFRQGRSGDSTRSRRRARQRPLRRPAGGSQATAAAVPLPANATATAAKHKLASVSKPAAPLSASSPSLLGEGEDTPPYLFPASFAPSYPVESTEWVRSVVFHNDDSAPRSLLVHQGSSWEVDGGVVTHLVDDESDASSLKLAGTLFEDLEYFGDGDVRGSVVRVFGGEYYVMALWAPAVELFRSPSSAGAPTAPSSPASRRLQGLDWSIPSPAHYLHLRLGSGEPTEHVLLPDVPFDSSGPPGDGNLALYGLALDGDNNLFSVLWGSGAVGYMVRLVDDPDGAARPNTHLAATFTLSVEVYRAHCIILHGEYAYISQHTGEWWQIVRVESSRLATAGEGEEVPADIAWDLTPSDGEAQQVAVVSIAGEDYFVVLDSEHNSVCMRRVSGGAPFHYESLSNLAPAMLAARESLIAVAVYGAGGPPSLASTSRPMHTAGFNATASRSGRRLLGYNGEPSVLLIDMNAEVDPVTFSILDKPSFLPRDGGAMLWLLPSVSALPSRVRINLRTSPGCGVFPPMLEFEHALEMRLKAQSVSGGVPQRVGRSVDDATAGAISKREPGRMAFEQGAQQFWLLPHRDAATCTVFFQLQPEEEEESGGSSAIPVETPPPACFAIGRDSGWSKATAEQMLESAAYRVDFRYPPVNAGHDSRGWATADGSGDQWIDLLSPSDTPSFGSFPTLGDSYTLSLWYRASSEMAPLVSLGGSGQPSLLLAKMMDVPMSTLGLGFSDGTAPGGEDGGERLQSASGPLGPLREGASDPVIMYAFPGATAFADEEPERWNHALLSVDRTVVDASQPNVRLFVNGVRQFEGHIPSSHLPSGTLSQARLMRTTDAWPEGPSPMEGAIAGLDLWSGVGSAAFMGERETLALWYRRPDPLGKLMDSSLPTYYQAQVQWSFSAQPTSAVARGVQWTSGPADPEQGSGVVTFPLGGTGAFDLMDEANNPAGSSYGQFGMGRVPVLPFSPPGSSWSIEGWFQLSAPPPYPDGDGTQDQWLFRIGSTVDSGSVELLLDLEAYVSVYTRDSTEEWGGYWLWSQLPLSLNASSADNSWVHIAVTARIPEEASEDPTTREVTLWINGAKVGFDLMPVPTIESASAWLMSADGETADMMAFGSVASFAMYDFDLNPTVIRTLANNPPPSVFHDPLVSVTPPSAPYSPTPAPMQLELQSPSDAPFLCPDHSLVALASSRSAWGMEDPTPPQPCDSFSVNDSTRLSCELNLAGLPLQTPVYFALNVNGWLNGYYTGANFMLNGTADDLHSQATATWLFQQPTQYVPWAPGATAGSGLVMLRGGRQSVDLRSSQLSCAGGEPLFPDAFLQSGLGFTVQMWIGFPQSPAATAGPYPRIWGADTGSGSSPRYALQLLHESDGLRAELSVDGLVPLGCEVVVSFPRVSPPFMLLSLGVKDNRVSVWLGGAVGEFSCPELSDAPASWSSVGMGFNGTDGTGVVADVASVRYFPRALSTQELELASSSPPQSIGLTTWRVDAPRVAPIDAHSVGFRATYLFTSASAPQPAALVPESGAYATVGALDQQQQLNGRFIPRAGQRGITATFKHESIPLGADQSSSTLPDPICIELLPPNPALAASVPPSYRVDFSSASTHADWSDGVALFDPMMDHHLDLADPSDAHVPLTALESALKSPHGFSLNLWFKANSLLDSWPPLFGAYASEGIAGTLQLSLTDSGAIEARIVAAEEDNRVSSWTSIDTLRWHHLTLSLDAPQWRVRISIDGTLAGVHYLSQAYVPDFGDGLQARLGQSFDGAIGAFEARGHPLTDEQIAALWFEPPPAVAAQMQLTPLPDPVTVTADAALSLDFPQPGTVPDAVWSEGSQPNTGLAVFNDATHSLDLATGHAVVEDLLMEQAWTLSLVLSAGPYTSADGSSDVHVMSCGSSTAGFSLFLKGQRLGIRPGPMRPPIIVLPDQLNQPRLPSWSHVMLSFDQSTRQLCMYVNGEEVGCFLFSALPATGPVAYCRVGGVDPSSVMRPFIGSVASVQVWRRALSAEERLALLRSPPASTVPPVPDAAEPWQCNNPLATALMNPPLTFASSVTSDVFRVQPSQPPSAASICSLTVSDDSGALVSMQPWNFDQLQFSYELTLPTPLPPWLHLSVDVSWYSGMRVSIDGEECSDNLSPAYGPISCPLDPRHADGFTLAVRNVDSTVQTRSYEYTFTKAPAPATPEAHLTAPAAVCACDLVMLDASASLYLGPTPTFAWLLPSLRVRWQGAMVELLDSTAVDFDAASAAEALTSIEALTGVSLLNLQRMLAAQPHSNSFVAIPSSMLFTDATYTFGVRVATDEGGVSSSSAFAAVARNAASDCTSDWLPSLSISAPSKLYRTETATFRSTLQPASCAAVPVGTQYAYSWTLKAVDNSTASVLPVSELPLDAAGFTGSTATLRVPAGFLRIGYVYRAELTLELSGSSSVSSSSVMLSSGEAEAHPSISLARRRLLQLAASYSASLSASIDNLHPTPNAIVASIVGADRTRSVSKLVTFDASPSYDPDQADAAAGAASLSFAWRVEQLDGTLVTLPSEVSLSQSVLSIPPNTLTPDQTYVATVQLSSLIDSRTATASRKLTVQPAATVPLPLVAILGVGSRIRSSDVLSLSAQVVLLSSTPLWQLHYEWRCNDAAIDTQLRSAASPLLLSPVNSNSLVLRADSLTPGGSYQFTVRVRDPLQIDPATGSAATGTAAVSFDVDSLPTGGSCSVQPPTGQEFDTSFRLACSDWTLTPAMDALDADPLQYRWMYRPQMATATNASAPLSGWLDLPTADRLLPAGDWSITALIRDRFGNTLRVDAGSVQVAAFSCVTQPLVCLWNTTRTYIDPAVEAGEYDAALPLVKQVADELAKLPVSDDSIELRDHLWQSTLDLLQQLEATGVCLSPADAMQFATAIKSLSAVPGAQSAALIHKIDQLMQLLLRLICRERLPPADAALPAVLADALSNLLIDCSRLDMISALAQQVALVEMEGRSPGEVSSMQSSQLSLYVQRRALTDGVDVTAPDGSRITLSPSALVDYARAINHLNESNIDTAEAVAAARLDIVLLTFGPKWADCRTDSSSGSAGGISGIDLFIDRQPLDWSLIRGPIEFDQPLSDGTTKEVLNALTRCGGSVADPAAALDSLLTCSWWNPVTHAFSTDGCTSTGVRIQPDGSSRMGCECTHLTEFSAIFNRALLEAQDCPLPSREIMYAVLAIFYLLIAVVSLMQLSRIGGRHGLAGLRQFWLMSVEHSLMLALSLSRAANLMIAYSWWENMSLQLQSLLGGLPYLFYSWLFTYLVVAWASIYYQSAEGRRLDNPFAPYQTRFTIVNLIIVAVIFFLFVSMSFTSNLDEIKRLNQAGTVVIAVVQLGFAVFIGLYGGLLVRAMSKDFVSPYAKKLAAVAVTLSLLFTTSACLLFAQAAKSDIDDSMPRVFDGAYYVIDLLGLCTILALFAKSVADTMRVPVKGKTSRVAPSSLEAKAAAGDDIDAAGDMEMQTRAVEEGTAGTAAGGVVAGGGAAHLKYVTTDDKADADDDSDSSDSESETTDAVPQPQLPQFDEAEGTQQPASSPTSNPHPASPSLHGRAPSTDVAPEAGRPRRASSAAWSPASAGEAVPATPSQASLVSPVGASAVRFHVGTPSAAPHAQATPLTHARSTSGVAAEGAQTGSSSSLPASSMESLSLPQSVPGAPSSLPPLAESGTQAESVEADTSDSASALPGAPASAQSEPEAVAAPAPRPHRLQPINQQ